MLAPFAFAALRRRARVGPGDVDRAVDAGRRGGAARRPARRSPASAAGRRSRIGTIVAGLVELAQVFVVSRFAETSDVLVGARRRFRRRRARRSRSRIANQPSTSEHAGARTRRLALAGLIGWIAALAAYHWMPFDFSLEPEQVRTGLGHLLSAPMSGYYFSSEFNAVTQILRKIGCWPCRSARCWRSRGPRPPTRGGARCRRGC